MEKPVKGIRENYCSRIIEDYQQRKERREFWAELMLNNAGYQRGFDYGHGIFSVADGVPGGAGRDREIPA